jgi:hypothetical protein
MVIIEEEDQILPLCVLHLAGGPDLRLCIAAQLSKERRKSSVQILTHVPLAERRRWAYC